MVVLPTVCGTSVFGLMLMSVTVGLVVLIVLERFGQIHLHISLVTTPVHHRVVAMLPMVLLVEHSELLGRVCPWRSGGRRSVIGIEKYAGVSSRRSRTVGRVSRVNIRLHVLWIESLTVSFLVGQEIGHGMVSRSKW